MKKYILSIDQGTTSSRAILFDHDSRLIGVSQKEFTQICPKSGWVEHDAEEIWKTVLWAVKDLLAKTGTTLSDLAAIGITNQRETTVIWDRKTGEPIYHALCWQSRQSQAICENLIHRGLGDLIHEKTGLLINPYFSGSKIRWLLDHVEGAMDRAKNGELLFGTIDSWLIWKLTSGKVHATDFTNASRTMIFNIHTLAWDREILDALGIPDQILPEVRATESSFGIADLLRDPSDPEGCGNNVEVLIGSAVGDQQASLFGQCCFNAGDVKNTYGTGCFMLMNTQNAPIMSSHGLLTTIAWKLENEPVVYALEGSVFIAGSAVQWLRDGMRLFTNSAECEESSKRVKGSDGLYVVSAFVGLGTPYWDNDARGAVFGITRATRQEHFVNATVESIAYQSRDVMDVMKEEARVPIQLLAVDGGASANDYLMQFQADILDCPIARPDCLETTALGAAYLAGLTVGFWKNTEELKQFHHLEKTFTSEMSESTRKQLYSGWKKAVEATRVFKPQSNES